MPSIGWPARRGPWSAVAGQFTGRDPAVWTTPQPYAYVNDNPLNGTDPTGLFNLGGGVNALLGGTGDLARSAYTLATASIMGVGDTVSGDYGAGPFLPWGQGATLGASHWDNPNHNNTVTYGSFNSASGRGGWSFGAHCSVGFQNSFSSTTDLNNVLGIFHNINLNAGGLANLSLTVSWSDSGTFVVTPQYGLGAGASISAYDTDTIVGRGGR